MSAIETEVIDTGRSGEARLAEIVFPGETNHYGTLFGGRALALMDKAAFIAASRFTRLPVVTACTERTEFHVPVQQGELVEVIARVVGSGRTSVSVDVAMIAENLLSGERRLATRSRFVLVAIDEHGRPAAVPSFEPSSTP